MYEEAKKMIAELVYDKLELFPVGVVVAEEVADKLFLQIPNDINVITSMLVKHCVCFCKICRKEIRSNSNRDKNVFLRTGYCALCFINKYG